MTRSTNDTEFYSPERRRQRREQLAELTRYIAWARTVGKSPNYLRDSRKWRMEWLPGPTARVFPAAYPAGRVLRGAGALALGGLAVAGMQAGGLLALLGMGLALLAAALLLEAGLHEEFLVGDNFVEVRRAFLGLGTNRRVLGGSLRIDHGPDGKDPLWALSILRTRRFVLQRSFSWNELQALGVFLAGAAGWSLELHEEIWQTLQPAGREAE